MKTLEESLSGVINRVTYHNPDNGWSVLRVEPFNSPLQQETVTVHQTQVFAGATMEFRGSWTIDAKYGRQFRATEAIEKKPSTTAAIEKYLGSGLIKGVGPKTAARIVRYFKSDTLDVFESDIARLTEVDGIARKKLCMIEQAWTEHRAIRDVMMFLQGHGISTLFAVRIYKEYGDESIDKVNEDPYRLASDIYGIGFFSADKVALSLGLAPDSPQRMTAAIRQVLAASRDQGHCFLTKSQIHEGIVELIELDPGPALAELLAQMQCDNQLRVRPLTREGELTDCYYSKTLYYDEAAVAERLKSMQGDIPLDRERVADWIRRYCEKKAVALSDEQAEAVCGIVRHRFAILTGGPGCGKTTTTLVIVRLLEAMRMRVLLAAPTGRAAQRMTEVIGREARTIHRLLEWKAGTFQVNDESPLQADYLIVDECSMLDISLTASLLKAVPENCQVLFIGDADQLPSVGAGNVLKDMITSRVVPCFRLTQVFRQARQSLIIRYAHLINQGRIPPIETPFKKPEVWLDGSDCLFLDSNEATLEQVRFVNRVKRFFDWKVTAREGKGEEPLPVNQSPFEFRIEEPITSAYDLDFVVPARFEHVDLQRLHQSANQLVALKAVLKQIHPWSSLHYGLSAVDVVTKLYLEWLPKYVGQGTEIQVLSPMTRGSLGTINLNKVIQEAANPPRAGKSEIKVGERIFREGDRVIHRRNNYDLNVFNGDIGKILAIDNEELLCVVAFYPDSREVHYRKEDIIELDLAYAITIHKSQGSEFEAVILPVFTQHFTMLYRNLIYTGLTRAKKQAVFVGTRRALSMAVRRQDTSARQTALTDLLTGRA